MLLSACCCVCRHCRHLCITCSNVTVVLTLSVVVSSATDLPRLTFPWLSPTIGPSGKLTDDDVNNDPTGKPRLPAGRLSQTSIAPLHLCRACCHYLSPSSLLLVSLQDFSLFLTDENSPACELFNVGVNTNVNLNFEQLLLNLLHVSALRGAVPLIWSSSSWTQ